MIRSITRPVLFIGAIMLALGHPGILTAQEGYPPAEQLIERYVEAMGGRDALLGQSNSRVTGTISIPAAGITGSMVVEAAEGRVLTVFDIPGIGLTRSGYDGEVGWSMDPNLGPRILEGRELDAVLDGSNPLAALRDASLFTVRETVERSEVNGTACYKVRLVWKSGRETHDCYGVDTGLMVAQMASQESPMGAIEVVTLFEDYQEAEGVLSARRIRQQMMGMEQVMTMDTVEYGVVSPDAFDLPEAIRTLVGAGSGQ